MLPNEPEIPRFFSLVPFRFSCWAETGLLVVNTHFQIFHKASCQNGSANTHPCLLTLCSLLRPFPSGDLSNCSVTETETRSVQLQIVTKEVARRKREIKLSHGYGWNKISSEEAVFGKRSFEWPSVWVQQQSLGPVSGALACWRLRSNWNEDPVNHDRVYSVTRARGWLSGTTGGRRGPESQETGTLTPRRGNESWQGRLVERVHTHFPTRQRLNAVPLVHAAAWLRPERRGLFHGVNVARAKGGEIQMRPFCHNRGFGSYCRRRSQHKE